MINELAREIYENNKAKGFYDSPKNIGEMLCLIHSEVSEALECDRKNKYYTDLLSRQRQHGEGEKTRTLYESLDILADNMFFESFEKLVKDSFEDELADVMIRVMDLAAYKGIDIEKHILLKMRYNSLRPHKHGKRY